MVISKCGYIKKENKGLVNLLMKESLCVLTQVKMAELVNTTRLLPPPQNNN